MKTRALITALFLVSTGLIAQDNYKRTDFDLSANRAFIPNVGQFNNRNWQDNEIKYAINENPFYVFFTDKGLTYRFDKIIKNPVYKNGDHTAPKRINISELVHATWVNSNPDVEIKAEGMNSNYYSYAIRTGVGKETRNINNIQGFQKITYVNLYDNIDVEYILHPEGGIKYSVILHPGADPSLVQLKYSSGHTNVQDENISYGLNENGEFEIKTSLGDLLEHSPFTFEKDSEKEVASAFKFNNDILSFELGNYDNSKTIVIDPWVVSPAYNSSTAVWEVETDGAGNVYTIGGETPMELKKYNAAGTLQWTYVTPWDTNSVWLGTMATDNAGVTYITSGTSPEIERINTGGGMVWHNNGGGLSTEYWSITFNCDKTKLIVGGTGGGLFSFTAEIYDIDINNGNVLAQQTVGQQGGSFTPIEVRSISSSKNAKYIYLTHEQAGAINQNIGACPTNAPYFEVDNAHHLAYKCENYLPTTQNGGGLKALVANDNFFYTHDGDEIYQRDLGTGALITSVALPGGSANTSLGDIVVHCSGLAVDDCGNVYAGADDRVVKFDQNLNFISQAMTSFSVYDVSVNANGEVLAVGAQQDNNSTNRNGRIESISLAACAQYALVCCDANICPQDTVCETDAPFNLFTTTGGGTFSGTGITNTTAGTFDPSTSGSGTFTITYTAACGSDDIDVVVSPCLSLTACEQANGDITVTSGTGPYTWNTQTTTQDCSACTFGCNFPPGCAVNVNTWTFFANGTTNTPPSFPIQIVDNLGSTIVITGPGTLPACTASCDPTITAAGPFCVTDPAVNLTAVDPGGTWSGTGITEVNAGTFTPSAAGAGSHTITYSLSCGSSDTETITVNATDDATFTYAQASYCLTDADPSPSSVTLPGGTFSIDGTGVINATTGQVDIGASGVGTYVISYLTNGPCPTTGTFNMTITAGADATITAAGPFCENAATITLAAADPGGTWTGTGITNGATGDFDPATAGAGSHTITYTIAGSCGDVDTETIQVDPLDDATFAYAQGSYCLTDANPLPSSVTMPGGTFSIDNGGTINAATGEIDIAASGAGSYTVSYLTNGPCPTTGTFGVVLTSGANATITPAGPFCENDPATNLTAADAGGTWTGNGITDATLGTFDPATAGAGTHTITYTISGSCGAVGTEDITVNAVDDATFAYAQGSYCLTDANPLPSSVTTPGGTFSIDNGGTINAATGEIDIPASGAGNYTVTYLTAGACPASSTFSVTLTSGADATITPAGPFCETDAAVNLVAVDAGGTWTGTGITDATLGTFDPATAGAGTHSITYTIAGGCGDVDTEDITVNPADDATFDYPQAAYCVSDADPVANIIGTAGGTFTIDGTGVINAANGTIDLDASGNGSYTVTYTTSGPCPATSTFAITITTALNSTITAAGPFCDTDAAVNLTAVDAGGTWSGTGITDPTLGTFDPNIAGPGTHTITYTIAGACGSTSTQDIVVNPTDDASFNYASASYCTVDPNPVANVTGTPGGTFSIDNGGTIDPTTGEINLGTTAAGTYTITYTTNGACPASSTATVTITDGFTAVITQAGPFCLHQGEYILEGLAPGGVWSGPGITDTTLGIFHTDTAGLGTHEIIYTIPGSCGDADTILVEVFDNPNAVVHPSYTIDWGGSVIIDAVGGSTYNWSPDYNLDCSDCQSPTASPTETTIYCVSVTENGCVDTACTKVNVELNCPEIYVPNAITPLSDDENAVICAMGGCVLEIHMRIYDRWGELVFETNDLNSCWDGTHMRNGKLMSSAVFVYILDATLANGEKVNQKGNISLIR